jgi:hypothetical protein
MILVNLLAALRILPERSLADDCVFEADFFWFFTNVRVGSVGATIIGADGWPP